jgi:large subunit ribosomal protein L34e
MTPGINKSRRLRRVKVKTCKGTTTHFKQENRQIAKCAITKQPLRGLPRLTNKKFGKLNKTQKTISRPYGGYMSHQALKDKIFNEMIINK